jgi:hypothetical protein
MKRPNHQNHEVSMSEKIAAKIAALLKDNFIEGVIEGRRLERLDIVNSLSGAPRTRKPRQPRTNGAEPTPEELEVAVAAEDAATGKLVEEAPPAGFVVQPVEQPAPGSLTETISATMRTLQRQEQFRDGMFPDTIADHIKAHGNGNADVTGRLVRQTLREMTLNGQARRAARGRYVIGDEAPPPGTLFHAG